MFRRSLEWFAGSVVVYVLTAACAATGGIDSMVEMATGGLAAMIGGNTGSGAVGTDGQGAESSGAQASDGSGAQGEGATGGTSIIDPVPDADAAEDGTRIVNLYMTTSDGLRTPQGFHDKELDVACWFQVASDGKTRCLPGASIASVGSSYFLDAECTQRGMLLQKANCPPEAGNEALIEAGACGTTIVRNIRYAVGAKASTVYTLSGETCTANTTLLETYDFYAVGAEIPPSTYAEGALVQGDQ